MALQTKTIDGSTVHNSWDFKLVVVENSTSTANNNSSVTITPYIGRIGSSSYMTGAEISCPISVTGCSEQTISGRYTTGTIAAGAWYSLGSKTFSVPHDSDGSKDITISASFTNDVNPKSGSASGSMTLTKIPRQANITGADNFNDEGNPKITYSNLAGNSVSSLRACISLTGSTDDIAYRDVSKTGTSYTFYLTDSERNILRNACPTSNSRTVYFYLETVISGSTYRERLGKTLTIVNGNPTFTDFEYKDTNEKVTSIAGNNQVLVKGLSNLEVTISSSNKMVANKGSSANKYIATIDNTNVNSNYSTNDLIINLGSISSAGTKRLNVRAYDSRNNSTLVYKDIIVYDYDKPVINATVNRLNNFENQTTLQVSGTYSRLAIDEIDRNIVNTLQYRYCEVDGDWSEWQNLTATIENGIFSCNDVILSLDNTKAFKFEIQAIDNLDSNSVELPLDIGQAIFFISSNKKACYINGQEILTYDIVDELVKSFKYKDDYYLDSTGIVHNKKLLNEILDDYVSKIPKTIYTGKLHGGESIVLENPMRFLDVYFRANFGNLDIFGKYSIDTTLDEPTYGSCVLMASDETSGLDYYVSECMYNKSTKKLTHSRTGYFQIANNTYTSRNGADYDYTVYRVDTHN